LITSFICLFTLLPALGNSFQRESVCGNDDRRVVSFSPVGIARELNPKDTSSYCTVTLVSDSCALSAGHCLHVLEEAEFFSSSAEFEGHLASFKYSVVPGSVSALQSRIGNDWAVMRLQPNKLTGVLPGKVHGFVDVELNGQHESPNAIHTVSVQREKGNRIEVLGADGSVLWTQGSIMFHDLDTDRGSSGSLIFDSVTGRAVAIHTHGGCDTMKNNKATYISQLPFLVKAIQKCRAEEVGF
jgi:V8-like Glu-specific endopeptidase